MLLLLAALGSLLCVAHAALYDHEDSAPAFPWLHAILAGMGVPEAVAASILTVCGVRACTTGRLRDSFACKERWAGLLALLAPLWTISVVSEGAVLLDNAVTDRTRCVLVLDGTVQVHTRRGSSATDAPTESVAEVARSPAASTARRRATRGPWPRESQTSRS